MRTILTALLWTLLIFAMILVALRALVLFPVILFFGADSPSTTTLQYLSFLAIPPLAVAFMIGGAITSLRLWYRPRWRYASFPIALALIAIAAFVWVKTRPH